MIISPRCGKYKHLSIQLDECDLDIAQCFDWYIIKRVTANSVRYYAEASFLRGGKVLMHRLVMGSPDCDIDHIDHNGLNNRRHNLREASRQQNLMNQRPQKKYKGVTFDKKASKWVASIKINGRRIHLGRFVTELEAAHAYDRRAIPLFGRFAFLNFPKDEVV